VLHKRPSRKILVTRLKRPVKILSAKTKCRTGIGIGAKSLGRVTESLHCNFRFHTLNETPSSDGKVSPRYPYFIFDFHLPLYHCNSPLNLGLLPFSNLGLHPPGFLVLLSPRHPQPFRTLVFEHSTVSIPWLNLRFLKPHVITDNQPDTNNRPPQHPLTAAVQPSLI